VSIALAIVMFEHVYFSNLREATISTAAPASLKNTQWQPLFSKRPLAQAWRLLQKLVTVETENEVTWTTSGDVRKLLQGRKSVTGFAASNWQAHGNIFKGG